MALTFMLCVCMCGMRDTSM